MKHIILATIIIISVLAATYFATQIMKEVSYIWFYEELVIETLHKEVKKECLAQEAP